MPVRTPTVLLSQADERLEAGDIPSAGCHAREAIRRYLRELCDTHDCRPKKRRAQSAKVCHRAVHLFQVRANKMRITIHMARFLLSEL